MGFGFIEVKKAVCRDKKRKYYRFRFTRHYGGIATADCVGCNLKCFFCWSFRPRDNPYRYGRFYSPSEISNKLKNLADSHFCKLIRISGNEPTLCKEHLLEILNLLPSKYTFILETNGTLIDKELAKNLSEFSNIHVRISLKSPTPEKWEKITGTSEEGFFLQMEAMRHLKKFGVPFHPAIMYELFTEKREMEILISYLLEIDRNLPSQLEFEFLQILPPLKEKIRWGIREKLIKLRV